MNLENPQELKKLIEGCIKGKRKYQKMLHEALYSKIYVSCLRYASCKAEAEDYLHEGFIKLYQNLGKYQYKGSFEGWARRIVINNTIDEVRKKREFAVEQSFFQDTYSTQEEDPSIKLKHTEMKANLVIASIQELSPAYRTILNMRLLDGMSYAEIAEILNIKLGTAKSNYVKAKRKLIENLKEKQADLFDE